ncbi:MAG: response regulator [Actinomycetales bacterium]
MIRVIVVDDQGIVREGLVTMLDLIEDVEVVAQAANGEDAVRQVALNAPDVVLMDLRMPVRDGVWATGEIARNYPGAAVLVLTTFDDDESITDALTAGARGYLTKDAGRIQLETAIRAVAAGHSTLSADVSRRLLDRLTHPQPTDLRARALRIRERFPDLTARECEVAALVLMARTNAEISEELFVSTATVKSHVNALFRKLAVTSRSDAIIRLS